MNAPTFLVAALIIAPAVGLVGWAWFIMSRVEADLRASSRFEAMHFEIGPQARRSSDRSESAGWPIAG